VKTCRSKLLVAADLSSASKAIIAAALKLTEELGWTLVLLHVMSENTNNAEHLTLQEQATAQLQQWVGDLNARSEVEVLVKYGHAAQIIQETARTLSASAIMMGNQPRSRWLHWLRPDLTTAVMRNSPCPVWLLEPGKCPSEDRLTLYDTASGPRPFVLSFPPELLNWPNERTVLVNLARECLLHTHDRPAKA